MHPGAGQLLPVLLHVYGQLALQSELVPTLGTHEVLFFLVQHNVRLETSHSGELLVTDGAGGVLPIVGAFVQCQVELNIECLGTLVTAMWLVISLVTPHVALELGLFGERQQTDLTLVEVWDWLVIISVLCIQC